MFSRQRLLAVALSGAALLAGCATTSNKTKDTPPPSEERVFFPAKPSAPRIQHLTSIGQLDGWGKGAKVRKDSSFAQWVAGKDTTVEESNRIDQPYGIDAYNGKVYVCDLGRNCVHVIDAANGGYTVLGSPEQMLNPVNITIDRRDGTKYVCDNGRGVVLVFDGKDKFVRELGDPQTFEPMDLAILDNELYIADATGEVEVWSKEGQRLRALSRHGQGPDELDRPTNLAIGPDRRVYVSDTMAQQVKIFDREGQYQGSIGKPGTTIGSFARPKGIAIDDQGHVYVSDAQWRVVQVFTSDDKLLTVISGMGGKAPGVVLPAGLAIDKTSLKTFEKYIDSDFAAEYLVFLVNQHGRNKVSVYAYGKSKSLPASEYEIKPLPPTPAAGEAPATPAPASDATTPAPAAPAPGST